MMPSDFFPAARVITTMCPTIRAKLPAHTDLKEDSDMAGATVTRPADVGLKREMG